MKKKFTMLFAALLACVGVAKAQWTGKAIESVSATPIAELKDGYYVLYNNGRGTFLNSEGALGQAKVTWPTSATYNGVEALNSSENLTNGEGATSKNAYVFYANVENGTVSLQTGYGDYVPVLTANGVFNYVATEGFWNYNLVTAESNSYVFLYGDSKGLDCNGWGADSHTYSTAAGWDKDGAFSVSGNQSWTLYEVVMKEVSTVNVTYRYCDGETLVKETTTEVTIGASYPAVELPDYVSTSGAPTGVVGAEDETYEIQCSLSAEFPFSSTDYFGLTTRGGAKWLIGTGEGQALTKTGLSLANHEDAAHYSWIVEGTWYDGFYFRNKETGMYLAAPSANPSNGDESALTKTKDDNAKFAIDLKDNKYYIRLFGTNNNCVSDFGGADNASLKFWNSTANYGDAGSMFAVVSTVEPQSMLEAFKNENAAIAGYVGGYDATAEEINNLTLETVKDFIANKGTVAVTDGYYRIQNYLRSTEDDVKNMIGIVNGERKGARGNLSTVDFIWKFEKSGDNGYKIKNANRDLYMSGVTDQKLVEEGSAAAYTFADLGKAQWKMQSSGATLVMFYNDGTLGHWGDISQNSDGAWYIIPATDVEVTINEFASICLPFDVKVEGAQAYAVTATSADAATLTAKEDIPAGQGAILEGNSTAKLVLTTAASDWNDNLLEGTTVATEVEGKSYILANGGNGIGLYSVTLADGKFTNGANKAYLPASAVANANVAMFSFERGEGTTSIEQVAADTELVIYDLAGRRVEKMEKGIYIVNGKKVVK